MCCAESRNASNWHGFLVRWWSEDNDAIASNRQTRLLVACVLKNSAGVEPISARCVRRRLYDVHVLSFVVSDQVVLGARLSVHERDHLRDMEPHVLRMLDLPLLPAFVFLINTERVLLELTAIVRNQGKHPCHDFWRPAKLKLVCIEELESVNCLTFLKLNRVNCLEFAIVDFNCTQKVTITLRAEHKHHNCL